MSRIAEAFRDLGGDVRFALRMMRRQPVHAVASTLTLALGIGATTAVFAVVDATLLRPLAYHAPERLVALNAMMSGPDGGQLPYSLTQIELLRWRAARAFEYIESIEPRVMALTGAGDPEVVRGGLASSGPVRSTKPEPSDAGTRSGRQRGGPRSGSAEVPAASSGDGTSLRPSTTALASGAGDDEGEGAQDDTTSSPANSDRTTRSVRRVTRSWCPLRRSAVNATGARVS